VGRSVFLYRIARGIAHGFADETDSEASCLVMMTPAVLGTSYFQELADLTSAGGPPDPAKVKAIMMRYGPVPVPPKTG
jgi:hypothetical protein